VVKNLIPKKETSYKSQGRRGRDRMVVGFTTTYAISAYNHWCCEFESLSGRGVQHYVIKFVSGFRQVGGFLRVISFLPPIKLSATLNPIKQINKSYMSSINFICLYQEQITMEVILTHFSNDMIGTDYTYNTTTIRSQTSCWFNNSKHSESLQI